MVQLLFTADLPLSDLIEGKPLKLPSSCNMPIKNFLYEITLFISHPAGHSTPLHATLPKSKTGFKFRIGWNWINTSVVPVDLDNNVTKIITYSLLKQSGR